MPINIRPRGSSGTAFELRIKHKLLPKAVYRTCSSELQARQVGAQTLAELDRGSIPSRLNASPEPAPTVGKAIRLYLSIAGQAHSTELLLETLENVIGEVPLAHVNWSWTEAWLKRMKIEDCLAPGTIRKRKGALSRVLHWVTKVHPLWLANNPLQDLPKGYSSYDRHSRSLLADRGVDVPRDVAREQRIDPSDEEKTS